MGHSSLRASREAALESKKQNFPGGLVVKTLPSNTRGSGFNPWLGELRFCMPLGQNIKQK